MVLQVKNLLSQQEKIFQNVHVFFTADMKILKIFVVLERPGENNTFVFSAEYKVRILVNEITINFST